MMDDLKPCPFCGDTDIRVTCTDNLMFVIGCNTEDCIGLRCVGKVFRSENKAIEAWNRRVEPYKGE